MSPKHSLLFRRIRSLALLAPAFVSLTGISECSSQDGDGDGWTTTQGDCNDASSSIYPGAAEVPYDGVDQDCDGEDLADVDGDGAAASIVGGPDCDDEDASIGPDAREIVGNKIDDDCDDSVDEIPGLVDLVSYKDIEIGSGTYSGVQYDGEKLWVTWGSSHNVYAQALDLDMNKIGQRVLVLENGDLPNGEEISDHVYLYHEGHHYILFSNHGDTSLYLSRFDKNWVPDASITPIIQNHTGTNDSVLTTNGTDLYAGCFCGSPGSARFYQYSPDLQRKSLYYATPASNLASAVWAFDRFYHAYNQSYGSNGIYQVQFSSTFVAQSTAKPIVTSSTKLEYFPTGLSFDPWTGHFYLAHAEGTIGQPDKDGFVMLRAFTPDWVQTDAEYVSVDLGNRAHTETVEDKVFVSYDTVNFQIRLHRYDVTVK